MQQQLADAVTAVEQAQTAYDSTVTTKDTAAVALNAALDRLSAATAAAKVSETTPAPTPAP
jgi:uncharacterized protein YukE